LLNPGPELIEKCIRKDRRAQNELYKLLFNFLISICWRYAKNKNEAVHCLNSGFLKIVINLKKYKPEIPFELWIRRIMINAIIDEFRKTKSYKTHVTIVEESKITELAEGNQDDNSEERNLLKEILEKGVNLLPPMTQKVFNMYVVDGFKHKEIASMLNISEGTSQWHYSFAKKKLKEFHGKMKG
jgi:RNA polymerase sigma-70 factor (ECF subfamily)